jgi:hypothetical protein
MTRRGALLAPLLAVALLGAQPAQAELPQGAGQMDGIWEGSTGAGVRGVFHRTNDDAPLTPDYAAKVRAALEAEKEGRLLYNPAINCVPEGMPHVMNAIYPIEIVTKPDMVLILAHYMGQVRRIYTDGRKHPAGRDPSYLGHSIGHWEGDTLVVDTIGLKENGVISQGMPRSDEMRITERIRLIDRDTLQDDVTLIDPIALTRPWSGTLQYKRAAAGTEMTEFVCAEGNRLHAYPDGRVITVPWAEE